MSGALKKESGFSMVELLLAMVLLVMVVLALAGLQRALAARFATLNQYRLLWHHLWNQAQLQPPELPEGWQVKRMQTTQTGCVSITVKSISPLGRQGQLTRLHCPVSK